MHASTSESERRNTGHEHSRDVRANKGVRARVLGSRLSLIRSSKRDSVRVRRVPSTDVEGKTEWTHIRGPEFSTTEAAAEEKALDSHINRLGWRDKGWGGEAWEARSTDVGMVRVKCTVKSGRWKCELGRTCDARSMDSEWGAKSRVEYKPASGRHRSHGPAEAWCRDHARSTRVRLRDRGSKSADNVEDWHLVECQWKIQGDARAGRRHKSESMGAHLRHAVEQKCGMWTPRVGVRIGRQVGDSKRSNCD
ncbi:hypothetical protein B0H13DRAFT_2555354 [Mycena leptocephala]|nr:hypothetical protein B0H13DRAFT_2555354 [Mycena leptocephala]